MAKKSTQEAKVIRFIAPTLTALQQLGGSGTPKEVYDKVAIILKASDEELSERYSKTGVLVFNNQIAFARNYLAKDGYIDSSERNLWALTQKGSSTKLSHTQAAEIYRNVFAALKASKINGEPITKPTKETILEEESFLETEINNKLSLIQLLQTKITPVGFEHLCLRLLREHGFEDIQTTKRSGDGGIDGFAWLPLNPFVKIKIAIQCKRYSNTTVSRGDVGLFRNDLGNAEKGIFITTSTFSSDAKKEAAKENATPIELIDGDALVKLFEKVELGLTPRTVYDVDYSFFEQFAEI